MSILSDYSRVVRDRNGRALLFADVFNKFADWLVFIGANVLLYETGGPVAIGIYAAMRVGIPMIITPFAGQIGMRFAPKRVTLFSAFARAVCFAILAGVSAINWGAAGPSWALTIALLLLASVLSTPYVPAERRLAQESIAGDALGPFNGLLGIVASVSVIVAPALGSVLRASLGGAGLFAIDAAMFGVGFVSLLFVAAPESTATPRKDAQPVFAGLWQGLRVIAGVPAIRSMVLLQTAGCLIAGSTLVLVVPISGQVLSLDDVGYLTSLIGVTSLVGAFIGGHVARRDLRPAAMWSIGGCAVLVLLLGILSASLLWVLVLLALLGFLANIADPLYWTTYQKQIPPERAGAAFGMIDANITLTMVVGQALVGFVLAASNVRTVAVVVGCLAALLLTGALVTTRSFRTAVCLSKSTSPGF